MAQGDKLIDKRKDALIEALEPLTNRHDEKESGRCLKPTTSLEDIVQTLTDSDKILIIKRKDKNGK